MNKPATYSTKLKAHHTQSQDIDHDRDSNLEDVASKVLADAATRPPPALQWVSVGKGGKVSSVRTVRSHVSKEYHQKRKESKKADLDKLTQQRRVTLQPRQSSWPVSVSQGQKSKSGNVNATADAKSASNKIVPYRNAPLLSPATELHCQANLIPYAWFEKDGPILYVNRLNWPFSAPFNVTGSDRKDLSQKALTPRQSGWMPSTKSPDFMAVQGAVLDPNVLLWIGQSPECYKFRVETTKWIQRQLEDRDKATSNATIAAIMTFAQWTVGYGSLQELSNHMDAIERIVELRGGFFAFEDQGTMTAKLTLFDSMVAIVTGNAPRFPSVTYIVTKPISPTDNDRMIHQESPLIGCGSFDKIITYHDNLEAIITLLNSMRNLTQSFEGLHRNTNFRNTPSPDYIIDFVAEPQHDYKIPLLTLPLISRCNDSSHHHVLDTLTAATALYAGALTNPTANFDSTMNEEIFQQLCIAMAKCSHDSFWARYPGILLWVLLIGAATARGKKEAAFWMFYLSRTGRFSDAETWLVGSAAIRRFIDIQRWIREENASSW